MVSVGIFAGPMRSYVTLAIVIFGGWALAIVLEEDRAKAAAEMHPAGRVADANAMTFHISGRVEDETGQPAIDALVETPSDTGQNSALTGPAGQFSLAVSAFDGQLWAATRDGSKQGYLKLPERSAMREWTDVRLVLKKAREFPVSVNDEHGQPILRAWVAASANYAKISEAVTDAAGKALIRVPADAPVTYILAMKEGVGLDYVLFRQFNEPKRDPFRLGPDHRGPIAFVLRGARTVRVRVSDEQGGPMEGVDVAPLRFQKPEKGGDVQLSELAEIRRETDARGIAYFRMIPADNKSVMVFRVRRVGYCSPQRWTIDPTSDNIELAVRLWRQVHVRGRVVDAQGRPAIGASVLVSGQGNRLDGFRAHVITNADGRFELDVDPELYYMFVAEKDLCASAAHMRVIIRDPGSLIELQLEPAVRVFGRVTAGDERSPVARSQMIAVQRDSGSYYRLPPEQRLPGGGQGNPVIIPSIVHSGATDEQGRYAFHVGRGTYVLYGYGPPEFGSKPFEVENRRELEVNIHSTEGLQRRVLKGRVVMAEKPEQGVPDAVLRGQDFGYDHVQVESVSDPQGNFAVPCGRWDMYVYAATADSKLRGIEVVAANEDAVKIAIGPTGSARGTLVDGDGKVLGRRTIWYGVPVGRPGGVSSLCFGATCATGDDGRFALEGLVPGIYYEISVATKFDEMGRGREWSTVGNTKVEGADVVDLGRLALRP